MGKGIADTSIPESSIYRDFLLQGKAGHDGQQGQQHGNARQVAQRYVFLEEFGRANLMTERPEQRKLTVTMQYISKVFDVIHPLKGFRELLCRLCGLEELEIDITVGWQYDSPLQLQLTNNRDVLAVEESAAECSCHEYDLWYRPYWTSQLLDGRHVCSRDTSMLQPILHEALREGLGHIPISPARLERCK